MATKAELQAAYERCELTRRGVTAAESARDFTLVVQRLLVTLPDQHAAVSYQRRFLKSPTPAPPGIDLVLRYAPPMFIGTALTELEAWYDGGTKTERATLPDFPKRIETACEVLAHAVELWGLLAEQPTAVLHPLVNSLSAAVLPVWVSAGVVAQRPQQPDTYIRVSDTRRPAVAKCAECGAERTAALAELLDPTTCARCKKRSAFVLTRRVL